MTRNIQYFGILVLASVVIIYKISHFIPDAEGHPINAVPEKDVRSTVAEVPRKVSANTYRSYSQVLSYKDKRLKESKGNEGTLISNVPNGTGQSKTTNESIIGAGNVFTTDNKEEETLTNISVSGLKNYVEEDVLKAKQHIAFLKVHKAASTTLQTMFFKFGFERNLSFLLPVRGHYFSVSAKVHEDIEPPLHGDHYDIICSHGIFNYEIYSSLMPNDTIYLAVVRNPLDQFISAVHYYTELYHFKYLMDVPGDRIKNLITYPEKYEGNALSHTMNSMARDFGFQERHFFSESNKEAKNYLNKLGNIFDFVLIAEHFDESVILMKRLLNWSLKDILYISKNVRGPEEIITEKLRKKFRKRNKLDYMVYEFFYNKFKTTLRKSEESVKAETLHYKSVLINVQKWCSDSSSGEMTVEASEWNEEFTVNTRDCKLMTKHEIDFTNKLRSKT